MKLDTKKTIQIGFAFLSISAFWQMYNNVIPLVLTNTFHMNETISGAIMAADNILALFLLPLFGGISDRCKSRMGRRKPFVLFGTIAAVILMLLLPLVDNSYFTNPSDTKTILFIGILGCLLVAMGNYRSPAVALMPDVTPKPLRSKANAVINLMGALGGIIYLIITSVLYSSARTEGLEHVDYFPLFLVVAGIMLVSVLIVMITVNEVKLHKKMEEYEAAHPEDNLAEVDEQGHEELPREVKRSLIFLLISIAMWFIAYNAIDTWFTTYANARWNMSLGSASTCLTVGMAGAILAYIPIGSVAERIGRKKSILIGIMLLLICFLAAMFLVRGSFTPLLYVIFVLVGVGWAAISVNSLPMVVEMCKGSDVGKFTGYYYTFSMAAQVITPIASGWLMNHISYETLFPYSAFFCVAALITMQFVKHGDNWAEGKKGLEAFDTDM